MQRKAKEQSDESRIRETAWINHYCMHLLHVAVCPRVLGSSCSTREQHKHVIASMRMCVYTTCTCSTCLSVWLIVFICSYTKPVWVLPRPCLAPLIAKVLAGKDREKGQKRQLRQCICKPDFNPRRPPWPCIGHGRLHRVSLYIYPFPLFPQITKIKNSKREL